MEYISYMELSICQRYAHEAIQYYKSTYKHPPMNATEAEEAVRECFANGWFAVREPWDYIEKHFDVIVDQIGFMVEESA